jgi:hypothetical protein
LIPLGSEVGHKNDLSLAPMDWTNSKIRHTPIVSWAVKASHELSIASIYNSKNYYRIDPLTVSASPQGLYSRQIAFHFLQLQFSSQITITLLPVFAIASLNVPNTKLSSHNSSQSRLFKRWRSKMLQ